MGRIARAPAELKHGAFTLEQARAAGISPSALRGKSWRRLGTGIYCWAGVAADPWSLLVAWQSRLPPCTAFAGLTAAWLHRLDVDPCHPVEIVVPADSDIRSRPNLLVWHGDVSEVTDVRALRSTIIERTFRDLSRRLAEVDLLVLADQALRLGHGRFHELAAAAESPMETRLRWLLLQAGLPRPEVQSDLYDAAGRFLARADLYYPAAHLVIEFDGGNHRERLVSDDRRQNALVEAGYRIMRFTSSDVYSRPDSVVGLIKACLQEIPGPRTSRNGHLPIPHRLVGRGSARSF